MHSDTSLTTSPPGQIYRQDFPRFGLPHFANRFPRQLSDSLLDVSLNDLKIGSIDLSATPLSRTTIIADFHCVTTWSYKEAKWEGVSLKLIVEHLQEQYGLQGSGISGAVICGQDGYRTTLLMDDLMNDSVLVADRLNDTVLTVAHGAPIRLVAPKHYGYKNIKHLKSIAFYTDLPVVKKGVFAIIDHPRARVHKEERGRLLPGRIFRLIYRPFISHIVRLFRSAMH